MSNFEEIADITAKLSPVLTDTVEATTDTAVKVIKQLDILKEDSGKCSGDGTEVMPDSVKVLHIFFARHCSEACFPTPNSSNVKWAVPILILEDGWVVKSWVNPLKAKHLFLVSPKQKVYASAWAWGARRYKIDALEEQLIEKFSTL